MILHASTVAFNGRAALIRGASGTGKSSLALQLMAIGGVLVADDRTELRRDGDQVIARAAPHIGGLIEARGIGILRAETLDDAPLACVIDLTDIEKERLPQRNTTVLDVKLPLLHKSDTPAWPAAIRAYLLMGKADR